MGDTYPTIEWCQIHRSAYCARGYTAQEKESEGCIIVAVPVVDDMPTGFVLRREPCRTCHGKGMVTPKEPPKDWKGESCVDTCPTCKGAGGFSVLWAPCNTCGGHPKCEHGSEDEHPHSDWYNEDTGKVETEWCDGPFECSAAGCVNGMTCIGPPERELERETK